ncbi:hypothetical protein FRC20_004939 [Serendipita sp. 405]|nr:hypothetical protein FRC20_004939 [Serendipita sp. 405]
MKTLFGLASLVLALLPQASAHYRFISLIYGGVTTTAFQYVRQSTNWNSPVTDVTSNDLRCNVGATTALTANVTAGSTVGFALDQAIYHPGVLNVYMSKAPSTAASYDGSGKWFKIYQISAVTDGGSTIKFPTDSKHPDFVNTVRCNSADTLFFETLLRLLSKSPHPHPMDSTFSGLNILHCMWHPAPGAPSFT